MRVQHGRGAEGVLSMIGFILIDKLSFGAVVVLGGCWSVGWIGGVEVICFMVMSGWERRGVDGMQGSS